MSRTEVEKRTHARRLNLARRHLNQAQRRRLTEAQIKDTPEKPDYQIAKALGVSPTTVKNVRTGLEEKGDVSRLETSTDTLGRKQPRQRKPKSYRFEDASPLGYPITITEFAPEIFTWRANAPRTSVRWRRSGESFGELYSVFGNAALECLIELLKPTHTTVSFAYAS